MRHLAELIALACFIGLGVLLVSLMIFSFLREFVRHVDTWESAELPEETHRDMLQELVHRKALTHGPMTRAQALDYALVLNTPMFIGHLGWPYHPPAFPYDQQKDA